jgi:hypothetical protein
MGEPVLAEIPLLEIKDAKDSGRIEISVETFLDPVKTF